MGGGQDEGEREKAPGEVVAVPTGVPQPSPLGCALAGAVTTDGAEYLPTGGVQGACLPDYRCVGRARSQPQEGE